ADGRAWTFGELDARMGGFVAALRAGGVRRGDRMALRGSNRAETVVALLGMAIAGVTAVLVHPRLTTVEARVLIDDAEVALSRRRGVDALLHDGGKAPLAAMPRCEMGDPWR
nr:AMP-binding protein [Deltaproteobacteria bacterium]